MTAVAPLPSYEEVNRTSWGSNGGAQGLDSMNEDEVARIFMPRKSANRSNSSSSISSNGSSSSLASTSTTTSKNSPPQSNGGPMPDITSPGNGESLNRVSAPLRKKPPRAGPWPSGKTEPVSGMTTARPQSIITTDGVSAVSSMSSLHQPSPVVSTHTIQGLNQANGSRQPPPTGEALPRLHLVSMNGTFERKTIYVPLYPDVLRIGRQTNIKTQPTPINGYFDSKVLSRQHAEIWAGRDGKIWIRDIRSSNGTFVNNIRLSAENRDSEPHELLTGDNLELGIDIVSEDQKTVVHHKVAAKVELAGFLVVSTNILDMSFGDLDPSNGALSMSTQSQMQMRNRSSNNSSIGNNGRLGAPGSIAASGINVAHNRPLNFYLLPPTTENIINRLKSEIRSTKVQNANMTRIESFLSTLMSGKDVKNTEPAIASDANKRHSDNSLSSISFQMDNGSRFSQPLAPPPFAPLPQKPGNSMVRSQNGDSILPSLKRTQSERSRSLSSVQGGDINAIALVEALHQAKKEIDVQNHKLRSMEEMLMKEREAREYAEGIAKHLEQQLASPQALGGLTITRSHGERTVDSAENTKSLPDDEKTGPGRPIEMTQSSAQLQTRLETVLIEMGELKGSMESYKRRTEKAEAERDVDRKTLSEMILKIRAHDQSITRARDTSDGTPRASMSGDEKNMRPTASELNPEVDEKTVSQRPPGSLPMASRDSSASDQIMYHCGPYASMIGVVLIGMGLMAYLNGWQKVER